jgi:gamma-glutamyl phosphate reductase
LIFGLQARLREAASLEKHVLLKKLRDALESLKGRVAGRNKDDVEEAIAMVGVTSLLLLSNFFQKIDFMCYSMSWLLLPCHYLKTLMWKMNYGHFF